MPLSWPTGRKDRAWLAAKVAELKAELAKLAPTDNASFSRELMAGDGRAVDTPQVTPGAG